MRTKRKILIAIDLQNGFNTTNDTNKAVQNAIRLIDSGTFDAVISTMFKNDPDSMCYKVLNWHEMLDSPETDLVEGLSSKSTYILKKNTYSCANKEFMNCLKKERTLSNEDEIYVCGLDTDACVLGTLFTLFDSGIKFKVVEDCCASSGGNELHNAALRIIKRNFGKNALVMSKDIKNDGSD